MEHQVDGANDQETNCTQGYVVLFHTDGKAVINFGAGIQVSLTMSVALDGVEDVEMKSCDRDICAGNENFTMESEPSVPPEIFAEYLKRSFNGENVSVKTVLEQEREALFQPQLQKKEKVARADICLETRLPKLVSDKNRIKVEYGFDVGGSTYLWPEEALYLLETGKLEIYLDNIALSGERARHMFLHSNDKLENSARVRTCGVDEYAVYKHLTKLGYRVRRRQAKQPESATAKTNVPALEATDMAKANEGVGTSSQSKGLAMDNEDVMVLEQESDPPNLQAAKVSDQDSINNSGTNSPEIGGKVSNLLFGGTFVRRGEKRSAASALLTDDDSSSSSHQSMKQDAGKYYVEEFISEVAGETIEDIYEIPLTSAADDPGFMLSEPIAGPSSAIRGDSYVVSEADSDSDIEFVEEVYNSHKGVTIEEVAECEWETESGDSEFYVELGTGKAYPTSNDVIVDLVSTDESDNEYVNPDDHCKIWSTFVPNAKIQVKYPPSHLLPHNIPARENKVYDFNLMRKAKSTELENIVEELNLEASPPLNVGERTKCSSWQEWRQLSMSEARDVMNESLLACGHIEEVFKNLHLWGDNPGKNESFDYIRVPFDLYSSTYGGVAKRKGVDIPPNFHIAIVRSEEQIPKLSDLGSVVDDGIPLLISIVGDEHDPMFISSNMSALPTLT